MIENGDLAIIERRVHKIIDVRAFDIPNYLGGGVD